MKGLRVLVPVIIALSGMCLAQEGWNIVSKTTSGTIPLASSSYVDVLPFYNALGAPPQDVCKAINTALLSVTATGSTTGAVTIDARGIPLYNSGVGTSYVQCLTNPFSGTMAKGYSGKLLLGQGPIITGVQWNMPNQYFWIEGLGLSNSGAPALGTVIQASDGSKGVPGFACSNGASGDFNQVTIPTLTGMQCPLIFIAGSANLSNPYYDALGTGIRNLTVDCNTISHCVGVGSFDVQEGGGLDTVSFINQDTACVVFDSSGVQAGKPAVSNPFIRNVDCGFSMPQTPPTKWIGLYINATDGPAEISNTTVAVPGIMNANDPQFDYCLYLVGGRGVNINYFHCEHAALAAEFLSSVTGASIRGLTASVTAVGVQLMNSTDTSIHDIEMNKYTTTGSFPYVSPLIDGSLTVGGTFNTNLASYVTSSTAPSMGATNVPTTITTDSGTASVFYKEQLIPVTGTTFLSTTPSAGTMMFCSDCAPSGAMGVCSSPGGPGTLAIYNGSHWLCR